MTITQKQLDAAARRVRKAIDALTLADCEAAAERVRKARETRSGTSTVDFVIWDIKTQDRLEAAKAYLRSLPPIRY